MTAVKPGDQVILNPMVDLVDGSKVTVRTARKLTVAKE